MPRIEFDFADRGREEDQVLPIPFLNAVDVGSESLSATLCPTKAFREYLLETILAFVEALGHNVVMLHSDQEPVLVQLLKAVQSRRVKRTLVRHGPRASHQIQGKIENANRVINVSVVRCGCHLSVSCKKTAERQHPDSVADSSRSVEADEVSSAKGRENCICACFGKVYTSQVLPFGERVMYKYTPCQQGIWISDGGHGIWVGKTPMTDDHIILT